MTRFSVSDENNNNDVGSSRQPLPKRPRILPPIIPPTTTTTMVPLPTAVPPIIPVIDEETSDDSDYSSDSDSEPLPVQQNLIQPVVAIEPVVGNGNSDVTFSDTDVLDCPICLDPLTIPVFQCENGHLACGSCCTKIRNKCPSCVMPIGYSRCRGMEKVLESVKTSCPNKQYGCVQKISYCQKLDHEKSCKYAPCTCPRDGCDFTDASTGLYQHVFVRHHPTKFSFNTMKLVELHNHYQHHIVLQEGNQKTVFVLNHVMVNLGSLINVICLAPTSSNMKFSYELRAALDGNLIKFESSVAVAQKFISRSPMKKFLVVTSDFYDRAGILKLELIIKKN